MRGQLKVGGGASVETYMKPRSTGLSAIVTRANGKIENHGVIGYWHRNPFINFFGVRYHRVNNAIRRWYYGVR